jgi:hypothetical protein
MKKPDVVTGDPRDLVLLDVNARYMTHEQYQRLVDNVRRDGALTSTPFVWRRPDGKGEVLSGNHRVKASIEAGLEEITWLESDDEKLQDRGYRVAVQLSHNAITGQDDPAVLAQLYQELEDLDLRAYSGLDDRTLELLAEVSIDKLAEANLDYQMLSFTFLPADAERAKNGFAEAESLSKGADERWLARYEDHFRLMDAIAVTGKAHDIRNHAAALSYVLDVFEANRTDLEPGWYDPETHEPKHDSWIPLSVVLGVTEVPASVAAILNKVINRLVGAGDLGTKNRWQVLEVLAADYLAGPQD